LLELHQDGVRDGRRALLPLIGSVRFMVTNIRIGPLYSRTWMREVHRFDSNTALDQRLYLSVI